MAKFNKEVLLTAINRRLMVPETKKKCLEKGIAALEDVIRKVILQLDDTLALNLTLHQLSELCFKYFMEAQSKIGIQNGVKLTEKNIDAYITEYISRIQHMTEDELRRPQVELNIELNDIVNDIRANLNKIQQHISLYDYENLLENVIYRSLEDYYKHLKNLDEIFQLSDIRYQALYYARQSCPEIVRPQPLTKELSSKFVEEFLYHFENIIYCHGISPLYLK
jgi:hypothetical protein